jgi:RNA polymerase sigma factor (sigma-70 family)
MQPRREHETSPRPSPFTETDWSAVLLAGAGELPESERALETLCRKYWQPIYAYLRCSGRSAPDAQDICQDLFASLIQRRSFASADRQKGRFRTFLLGALKHLLADRAAAAQAQKRGGGWTAISIDSDEGNGSFQLVANAPTPEAAYDRSWGLRLLGNALARLREEFSAAGKARQFEVLRPFLAEPPEKGDYAKAAQTLGMSSGTVTVSVHRMREDELRALFG